MQVRGEVDIGASQQNVIRGRSQEITVDLDAISWVLVDDRYGQQLEVISLIVQVHARRSMGSNQICILIDGPCAIAFNLLRYLKSLSFMLLS